jgi:hypothetical protein
MTSAQPQLPIEEILEQQRVGRTPAGRTIGHSREGLPILGFRYGRGERRISLIGGCHADEPVGPAMLRLLSSYLEILPADTRLLTDYSWFIVPHVNPDGEDRNSAWSDVTVPAVDHAGAPDLGYELPTYVQKVRRELPGDDIEFGFPRDADDLNARPENRAVASFLADGAPFVLHGSFHGMDFAPGPWFLIERAWQDRTRDLRDNLRRRVRALGYGLFDVDRGGEKGFHRIDEGFTTRPDSTAMRAHFLELGDNETAERFRPSSMEHVRGLGGDPFTMVSEMPLFLLPTDRELPATPVGTEGRLEFHAWLRRLIDEKGREGAHLEAERLGLRPMPIRDQMRLQLAFLSEGLAAVRR